MTVWPFFAVWPFGLVFSVILYFWNKPAAIAFFSYWALFQVVKLITPDQQVYMWYVTLMATVAFLCLDRFAGLALAIVAAMFWLHVHSDVSHFDKAVWSEGVIVIGMLICGISGPNVGNTVDIPSAWNRSGDHSPRFPVSYFWNRKKTG